MLRLSVLALAVCASGCMEGAFPWARRQPPEFAKDVISQGMDESLQYRPESAKPPEEHPTPPPAPKPVERSPLNWTLDDLMGEPTSQGSGAPGGLRGS